LLKRSGLLLAIATILLQIAVHLQPLLPEKYHIAPVCLSITHNLIASPLHSSETQVSAHESHDIHSHLHFLKDYFDYHHEHVHDAHNHQCQYCTVYGDLVMPPELGVQEVFDRLNIRLITFEKAHKHIYFELQKLFLMPQGRAPPSLSA
jgi:hypothetical protein